MLMLYIDAKISDVVEEASNSHLKYRPCVLCMTSGAVGGDTCSALLTPLKDGLHLALFLEHLPGG